MTSFSAEKYLQKIVNLRTANIFVFLFGVILQQLVETHLHNSRSTHHKIFMERKRRVGILGATGAVGQKFIKHLEHHPWFTIAALGASERSAGKPYQEAAHWIENTPMPSSVANMTVHGCHVEGFPEVDFVFSGLDSSVAGEVEKAFAEAGIPVISNAKNYRTDPLVPLLIPEVNPDHIELIDRQRFSADGSGWIVTNPNCAAVPLAMTLKPLHDAYGVRSVVVTSMQATSGAGYPGVASLDILGNVIPYIPGEESKIEQEPGKLLAELTEDGLVEASFPVQATATRVPVINGHLLSVSVSLERVRGDARGGSAGGYGAGDAGVGGSAGGGSAGGDQLVREVQELFESWRSPIEGLNLPSAPKKPLLYHENPFAPQPRMHADEEGGMRTAVGRLRSGSVHHLSYITMAHNTIRGAAGGAILNAELLVAKKRL